MFESLDHDLGACRQLLQLPEVGHHLGDETGSPVRLEAQIVELRGLFLIAVEKEGVLILYVLQLVYREDLTQSLMLSECEQVVDGLFFDEVVP